MLIDGIIYFAPGYPYMELEWNNPKFMAKAFQSRLMEFYLKNAKRLADEGGSDAKLGNPIF